MMTKAAYFVRFLEVLAEKREEKRNERWLQRTEDGTSRLLLFLIIVPSLSPGPEKFPLRGILSPRGRVNNHGWQQNDRAFTFARSFMSKYPQIEKSSQAIDMPRDRLPKI